MRKNQQLVIVLMRKNQQLVIVLPESSEELPIRIKSPDTQRNRIANSIGQNNNKRGCVIM